jgi:hypothetical protein
MRCLVRYKFADVSRNWPSPSKSKSNMQDPGHSLQEQSTHSMYSFSNHGEEATCVGTFPGIKSLQTTGVLQAQFCKFCSSTYTSMCEWDSLEINNAALFNCPISSHTETPTQQNFPLFAWTARKYGPSFL